MGCRGICVRQDYNHKKKSSKESYYSDEYTERKYCSVCERKIYTQDNTCFCCDFRLRTRPRNNNNHQDEQEFALITIENEPLEAICQIRVEIPTPTR